jgi:gamma-glutamyltranspeptidase / glutathione hydrolase
MGGAVAAGHPASVAAGADALANGGTAVDACLAAAFTAFVVEGPLTGPAGGGFLLVHEPGAESRMLDFFFASPSSEPAAMDEVLIEFAGASQVFHVGEGSVAVPGLLAGLAEAHRRHCALPWARLVDPAVELARRGVEITPVQAYLYELLAPILRRSEAGRRVYKAPDALGTDELADSLERIRDDGASALLELLPELADDLRAYRVLERDVRRARFRGTDVMIAGEPSIGGAVVQSALGELDRETLDASDAAGTASSLASALRAAYALALPPPRVTGTTHVSAVDGHGRAASLSMTLASGSGVFRGGFQLNNMLGEVDIVGIAPPPPGERLPSMMAPTIVLQGGRPRLVLGSAGSVRVAGAIVQVASRVIALGASVEEAVASPRLHPDGMAVHLEGGTPDDVAERLAADGWDVTRWGEQSLFFGGVQAVALDPGGVISAAGDPRRGGAGVVVP